MSANLPNFLNPPLTEVVLGVQFEPLTSFTSAHAGIFWQLVKEKFPRIQEHNPLPSTVERFGGKPGRELHPQLQFFDRAVPSRHWLLNTSDDQLIQLQEDRLLHNWRKRGTDHEYPRYESIREAFKEELQLFENFAADQRLEDVRANQCEVTYVNHIYPVNGVWENYNQVSKIINLVRAHNSQGFLSEPEELTVSANYLIQAPPGSAPRGRLRVTTRPGFQLKDNQPILVMELTARGQPLGEGLEGVLAFLDLGREWIVRGFASLTTTEMHNVWGRTDA